MVYFKLLHLISLFLISSCALLFGVSEVRKDERAKNYSYNIPQQDTWIKQKNKKTADAIYLNNKSGALLSINSTCYRYENATLESLMRALKGSIKSQVLIHEETKEIADREALYHFVRGQMDGIPVECVFAVMRKQDCVFDFILVSRDKLISQDLNHFNSLLSSFKYPKADKRTIAEKP